MATLAMKGFVCVGTVSNGPPLMGAAPLLSGGVPSVEDLVFKDGNGKIDECGADPANIAGVMAHEYNETYSGTFDGAGDLLQSTASTDMHYFRAHEDNRFIASLGGKASARTDEGKLYGIVKDGNGVWYIDGTDTTATRVRVLEIFNDDNYGLIGDTNTRVLCQFASNYQP